MTFSKRHGLISHPPVKYRYEAPASLRYAVVEAAYDHLSYDKIRTAVCRTLHQMPDRRNNWSEIPNIRDEVQQLMEDAEWPRVYDVAEHLVSVIEGSRGYDAAEQFVGALNDIFLETGGGWQYVPGEGIIIRGEEAFEDSIQQAMETLEEAGFSVAEQQLKEALQDVSRRPNPDLTGAIHHALGALEATARSIHGSDKSLADIAKQIGLPKPLDEALLKMWGFSSNYGRHVSPTKVPSLGEATLIVHLSSAYCRFLLDRNDHE